MENFNIYIFILIFSFLDHLSVKQYLTFNIYHLNTTSDLVISYRYRLISIFILHTFIMNIIEYSII